MTDRETLDVYNARAQDYANLVDTGTPDKRLTDFIAHLPKNTAVLDLGCGPGNAAAHIAAAGHSSLAWDASEEMVALARQRSGVSAHLRVFDDLETLDTDSLGGVWANFSLLHAPRADISGHFANISRAVQSGGLFLFAAKTGTGEERDKIGRLYTYFLEEEIRALLNATHFDVFRADHGREPGLSGEDADWFSLMARRQ